MKIKEQQKMEKLIQRNKKKNVYNPIKIHFFNLIVFYS